jgi:putative NADH-flavin reductase
VRIAVVGASGWLGGAIAREALARGHEVTAIGRDRGKLEDVDGAEVVLADVTDRESLTAAIRGHDVVVSAVTDRSGPDRSIIPATARALLEAVPSAGVPRLAVVGGGGTLEAEPGVRGIDRPDFPAAYRAEAEAQGEALDILRSDGGDVDWTYLSPPPHDLVPGEKSGGYRAEAGDTPVTNDRGESRITAGDFASAMVDELEEHRFSGRRFTAAYQT